MTGDEMVGWHHRLNKREFAQALGDGDKHRHILKSRDITLPKKVHLVIAMVFPVVMCGCESWTIKKAEC